MSNNLPQSHQNMPLNLKSLRTRFTLRFLKALKKINQTQHPKPDNFSNNIGNNTIYSNNSNSNKNVMVKKRYKKVKVAADASLASAVGPRRAWTRAIMRRARPGRRALGRRGVVAARRRKRRAEGGGEGGQEEELRRLVPGGEGMIDMQSLLDETLHYVKCLTTQVKVMRSIVDFCSSSPTS